MRNKRDNIPVVEEADDQGQGGGGFGRNPLADDDLTMATMFYARPVARLPAPPVEPVRKDAPRPTHYKVVSISLYNEDIDRIDRLVEALKAAGHTKANRSSLIRFAIDQVDITRMPKGY
jgi:hypothetical protein